MGLMNLYNQTLLNITIIKIKRIANISFLVQFFYKSSIVSPPIYENIHIKFMVE